MPNKIPWAASRLRKNKRENEKIFENFPSWKSMMLLVILMDFTSIFGRPITRTNKKVLYWECMEHQHVRKNSFFSFSSFTSRLFNFNKQQNFYLFSHLFSFFSPHLSFTRTWIFRRPLSSAPNI